MFTVLVHAHLHALLETTSLALVAMRFVHDASPSPRLAAIDELASDAAFEESRAPVASQDSIVLAAAHVAAHRAHLQLTLQPQPS